jgi:tRNA nucleotidyltransferase (CCA-adding enzyme)
MEALFQRLEGVVSWYNLLFIGETYERWRVPFLGLADGLGEKEVPELLKRLAFPENFLRSFLQHRTAAHQMVQRLTYLPSLSRSELYFLLRPLPTEFLLYAMGRTESAAVKKAISLYFTEMKRLRISLGGKDLKKMGFPPGPLYQEILRTLLRERLDGRIHTADQEADFVRKNYGEALAANGGGVEAASL